MFSVHYKPCRGHSKHVEEGALIRCSGGFPFAPTCSMYVGATCMYHGKLT